MSVQMSGYRHVLVQVFTVFGKENGMYGACHDTFVLVAILL